MMLFWKYRVLLLSTITVQQYAWSIILDFFREDQWLSIFSKMSKVQGNVEVIVVSMWWCRITSAYTNTCLVVFIKHCNMKVRLKPVLSFPLSSYTSKCNTYTSLCHNITMQGFFINNYITKFREWSNKNVYAICPFKLWHIYIYLYRC